MPETRRYMKCAGRIKKFIRKIIYFDHWYSEEDNYHAFTLYLLSNIIEFDFWIFLDHKPFYFGINITCGLPKLTFWDD